MAMGEAAPVDGGEGASMDLRHPAADPAGRVGGLLCAQDLELVRVLPDQVEGGVLDAHPIVSWVGARVHLHVPAPEQDAPQRAAPAHAPRHAQHVVLGMASM